MASGVGLATKVNALLRRFNATSRVVKLRKVTQTGGNPRLGIGGAVIAEDMVLDPQPTVSLVQPQTVGVSGGLYQLGDYQLTVSSNVTEDDLKTSFILYGDDQLKIVHFDPVTFGGVVVAWNVMARSVRTR